MRMREGQKVRRNKNLAYRPRPEAYCLGRLTYMVGRWGARLGLSKGLYRRGNPISPMPGSELGIGASVYYRICYYFVCFKWVAGEDWESRIGEKYRPFMSGVL